MVLAVLRRELEVVAWGDVIPVGVWGLSSVSARTRGDFGVWGSGWCSGVRRREVTLRGVVSRVPMVPLV